MRTSMPSSMRTEVPLALSERLTRSRSDAKRTTGRRRSSPARLKWTWPEGARLRSRISPRTHTAAAQLPTERPLDAAADLTDGQGAVVGEEGLGPRHREIRAEWWGG